MYQKRLVNFLEESEMKKKAENEQAISEVNSTRSLQMKQTKNNAIKKGDPIDIEACAVAAAQKFDGEDAEFRQKTKSKQEQVIKFSHIINMTIIKLIEFPNIFTFSS